MTQQSFYIDEYDWYVTVCYGVTCDDVKKVLEILNFFEIDESLQLKVEGILGKCLPNVGFTYTNVFLRETLVVIGYTASFDEFLNTLAHENMHCVMHITDSNGVSPYSEKPCYLLGDLIQSEADIIKNFICDR